MRAWTSGVDRLGVERRGGEQRREEEKAIAWPRPLRGGRRAVNAAAWIEPFVLFDDMRPGGAGARLYERPAEEIAALVDRGGAAGAGTIARRRSPAGGMRPASSPMTRAYALEPQAVGAGAAWRRARCCGSGCSTAFETWRRASWSCSAIRRAAGPGSRRPRIARDGLSRRGGAGARASVRRRLLPGQSDVRLRCRGRSATPLAAYARLRRAVGRPGGAGWSAIRAAGCCRCRPEQFFTIRGRMIEAKPMKGTAPRRTDPAEDRRRSRRWRRTPSSGPRI